MGLFRVFFFRAANENNDNLIYTSKHNIHKQYNTHIFILYVQYVYTVSYDLLCE